MVHQRGEADFVTASAPEQHRSALVTGGAGAIGRHICLALARSGFAVGVGYRGDSTRAQEVVDEINTEGGAARAVPAVLDDPDSVIPTIARMHAQLGPLGVLVNNAVAWPDNVEQAEPFYQTTMDWASLVRTNLEGTLAITRHCAQTMAHHHWGRIITVSTDLVDGSMQSDVSYIAAKGGMTAASRALAWELGPAGVTVNLVAPGLTAEKGATIAPHVVAELVEHTPLRRLVTAAEVAAAVAFLASENAGAITGHVLTVSGGH